MKRKASAVWSGGLRGGKGTMSSDSGVLAETQYSFSTRFEDGIGTNPEELIAAAHAGFGLFIRLQSRISDKFAYMAERFYTVLMGDLIFIFQIVVSVSVRLIRSSTCMFQRRLLRLIQSRESLVSSMPELPAQRMLRQVASGLVLSSFRMLVLPRLSPISRLLRQVSVTALKTERYNLS